MLGPHANHGLRFAPPVATFLRSFGANVFSILDAKPILVYWRVCPTLSRTRERVGCAQADALADKPRVAQEKPAAQDCGSLLPRGSRYVPSILQAL